MDNAKDPIVPNMTPSQDDIEIRQRQMKSRRSASAPKAPKQPNNKPAPEANTGSGGGKGMAVVATLVALLAVGGCGYLYLQSQQLQQQLTDANAVLAEQKKNSLDQKKLKKNLVLHQIRL